MALYSPPLAYWYLRKQQRRRAATQGAPAPSGAVLTWATAAFEWGSGNSMTWGT
jgi:hypothetical protein